jgi:hypothetical protein
MKKIIILAITFFGLQVADYCLTLWWALKWWPAYILTGHHPELNPWVEPFLFTPIFFLTKVVCSALVAVLIVFVARRFPKPMFWGLVAANTLMAVVVCSNLYEIIITFITLEK